MVSVQAYICICFCVHDIYVVPRRFLYFLVFHVKFAYKFKYILIFKRTVRVLVHLVAD